MGKPSKRIRAEREIGRNPIAVAMVERYGRTQVMRDRRERRPKDARRVRELFS